MSDEEFHILEEKFHNEMVDVYEAAKRECKYNASYFIRMISEMGGLKAAKRLIMKPEPTEGFNKLFEFGRLDLSVEAKVLEKEYRDLFDAEEIEMARKRLEQYGYKFEE